MQPGICEDISYYLLLTAEVQGRSSLPSPRYVCLEQRNGKTTLCYILNLSRDGLGSAVFLLQLVYRVQ